MNTICKILCAIALTAISLSCSTYQKITIYGEPDTEIFTPDKNKIGTLSSEGKSVVTIPRDVYYAYLLYQDKNSDKKIPFALDYKNKSFFGTKLLSGTGFALFGIGSAISMVTGVAAIATGEDGEDMGIAPLMEAGLIGMVGGGAGVLMTSCAENEEQRERLFEYLPRQSTNQDLRFEKFVDNGYKKEIGSRAVPMEENVAESSRKVESVQSESYSSKAKSRSSKSKRILTDLAKQVEGTYIGSGKLLLKDETIENYQDIKVVLKRLDKNTVQVDVYESNGEAYFNESGKYSVKKIDSGKYQLTMNGIPSATITIDANKKMVYLHPKVNIDGDLYALRITASKSTQANQDVNLIIETLNGVVYCNI